MMRTEKELFDLILQVARDDERIRAVILNGSRANPHALRDMWQDYDVQYIVSDLVPFIDQPAWVEGFGELLIMQMPDGMGDPPPASFDHFAYLMQFADGTRIDLTLLTMKAYQARTRDSLSLVLLDKDGNLGAFPPPDERGYLSQPPTSKAFDDCCNEFWWVSPYVAKGLWRGEIPYARFMLDEIMRAQLMKLLVWYIGMRNDFQVNPGKQGRYFQRYLESPLWQQLLQTYADAQVEHTWQALFAMTQLFRSVALQVAAHFKFAYPDADYLRVLDFLHQIRGTPN